MSRSTSIPDSELPNWRVFKGDLKLPKDSTRRCIWSNGPMVYACQFIRQSCENRTNKPTNTCWINIQATWEATKKETLTNQFNPFLIFHLAQPRCDLTNDTLIWCYLSGQSVKSRQPLPQGNPWKNPMKNCGVCLSTPPTFKQNSQSCKRHDHVVVGIGIGITSFWLLSLESRLLR